MNDSTPATLQLQCPCCDTPIEIEESRCVEGLSVTCGYCGAEPALTREWIEDGSHYCWLLIDPELEYSDDDRR